MSTDDNPIYIDIRSNLSYFFLAPPSPSSPPPVSSAPTAMQLLTAVLLAAAGLTAANPVPAPVPAPGPVLPPFFLQVTSDNAALNAKCVTTYHTGAGLADAVISDCGPAPAKLYSFLGTTLSFLGYSADGSIQAALRAESGAVSYDSWGPLLINAGDPGTAFTYEGSATGFLQQGNGLGFIACQWSHPGTYQLFALSRADASLTSNCSPVKLLKGCYNTDPGCNS
jgi:hypothetical protein